MTPDTPTYLPKNTPATTKCLKENFPVWKTQEFSICLLAGATPELVCFLRDALVLASAGTRGIATTPRLALKFQQFTGLKE